MGRVLRARHLKLGRAVALKVLVPGAHDARQLRRFEQEARAAGALNHPNILAVYDVGEHTGEPYIVTELLQGVTLRESLREGPVADMADLFLAPKTRRLAQIEEKRGNRQKAIAYYQQFVELWKDCDPELRLQVDEVRARLAALEKAR